MKLLTFAITLLAGVNAGTVLWDGRFNDLNSSSDLNDWSWSDEVGPYQYYIHGSGDVTEYINLSPSYKNPADTSSVQGAKFTLDSTAYWEGQTMRRTELIPQTSAAINSGKVWYHFSMMANSTNFPSIYREHQICFFESHFTEMKAGWISGESATSDTNLRWEVGSVSHWSTNFTAGVWHNIAYGEFCSTVDEYSQPPNVELLTCKPPSPHPPHRNRLLRRNSRFLAFHRRRRPRRNSLPHQRKHKQQRRRLASGRPGVTP